MKYLVKTNTSCLWHRLYRDGDVPYKTTKNLLFDDWLGKDGRAQTLIFTEGNYSLIVAIEFVSEIRDVDIKHIEGISYEVLTDTNTRLWCTNYKGK
jgi:hypothetical protein